MTWGGPYLDVRSGLFFPRLVTWAPKTGEFTCVEGPKGFATWQEADEAGRFLRPGEGERVRSVDWSGLDCKWRQIGANRRRTEPH